MKAKPKDKFDYIPYKRKLTQLARQNRNNPTPAEKKLWHEVLCRKQFEGYKFTRQKPIGDFIVDFYCSKLQLVIEIDGDTHAQNAEYDEVRTKMLNQYGLRVLRYTNRDVLNNIEGVHQDLTQVVNPPTPPYQPLSLAGTAEKVSGFLMCGGDGVKKIERFKHIFA